MIRRRLRDSSGYSMVEVLAAIVILSLAILPMVGMFDAGLRATSTSGTYDRARALANTNLEAAKSESFSEVAEQGSCWKEGDEDLECDVNAEYVQLESEDADGSTMSFGAAREGSGMLKVTVTVEWGSNDREYSTSGIVAQ